MLPELCRLDPRQPGQGGTSQKENKNLEAGAILDLLPVEGCL